jgi:antitoxin PrlF
MAESTVNAKGRTTMPAEIRAALRATAGTRLKWHVLPDGDVFVRAKSLSITALAASVKSDRHVDIDDMNPWRD